MPSESPDELFTFGQIELSPALSVEQRLRAEEAVLRQRFERHAQLILSFERPMDRYGALVLYAETCARLFGEPVGSLMAEQMTEHLKRRAL